MALSVSRTKYRPTRSERAELCTRLLRLDSGMTLTRNDPGSRPAGLVVAVGELLVDFVPEHAGTAVRDAESFRRAAGGAPANVAAVVALLGGRSSFIGRVGDDPFGRWLIAELSACGVDTASVSMDPAANTTLAFVSLAEDADRDFVFYRTSTADTRLSPADLDIGLLREASFLHFCSNSLSQEPSRSATYSAIETARDAGALISFDVNWRPLLWASQDEGIRQIRKAAALANILKLSESELELLTEDPSADPVSGFLAAGAMIVLVSQGAAGARIVTAELDEHVPARKVTAVDTTGAGDALAGALLHELSLQEQLPSGEQLLQAVRRATAVAGLSTTRSGAIPSYPTAAELERFLAQS